MCYIQIDNFSKNAKNEFLYMIVNKLMQHKVKPSSLMRFCDKRLLWVKVQFLYGVEKKFTREYRSGHLRPLLFTESLHIIQGPRPPLLHSAV